MSLQAQPKFYGRDFKGYKGNTWTTMLLRWKILPADCCRNYYGKHFPLHLPSANDTINASEGQENVTTAKKGAC